jgi:hypothetical protein
VPHYQLLIPSSKVAVAFGNVKEDDHHYDYYFKHC